MKKLLQFAVAKYTPDLARMEPRNIGIILWAHDGSTLARFLGEREDGHVHVPALVPKSDRHAYRQWIAYWRYQLKAESISLRSGELVTRSSSRFLEALEHKSKEQFRVVESGRFAEKLPAKEMGDVLEELFARLVERPQAEKARAELAELNEACYRLFKTAGLEPLTNLPVPRHIEGELHTFTADFALGAVGKPSAIMQRILLSRRQNIDSNILMFQTLRADTRNPLECAALIHGDQEMDENAESSVKVLDKLGLVIDVTKPTAITRLHEIKQRTDLRL